MSGIDTLSEGIRGGSSVWGANVSVAQSANLIDIWLANTAYGGMSADPKPESLEVVSTSDDDDVNGIGAARCSVQVLRTISSKAWETVEVDMDGTGPVSIGDAYRARDLRVIQFGSNGAQVGNLQVQDGSATLVYSYVPIGFGHAQDGVYTVPAGLAVDIRSIDLQCSRADGTQTAAVVALSVREFGAGGFEQVNTFNVTNQSPQYIEYAIPLRIPPLADVKLTILDASQTLEIVGGINFGP